LKNKQVLLLTSSSALVDHDCARRYEQSLPIRDKDDSVSLVVMRETSKQTVAVVGSGMAGLVAAFLIQRDNECRYNVEVFEKVNNHGQICFLN
jgi:hypothetical protein